MDYQGFYDAVVREIESLQKEDVAGDYRTCKALAACYELQDYLAECLAEEAEQTVQPE